ncbi:MAG: hypothetical protein ABSF80_09700 [Chitinispirillaceae bacterium]|jgi:hypothetical protein
MFQKYLLTYLIFVFIPSCFAFSAQDCGRDTTTPFFIEKSTVWVKTKKKVEIQYASFNSKKEFSGVYESERKDYVLLFLQYRYRRVIDNKNFGKFKIGDSVIAPNGNGEYFLIIGRGKNQLWIILSRDFVLIKNDTITIKGTGKLKIPQYENAIFVPCYPPAYSDYESIYDGKHLAFKSEMLDTLGIIIKDP